MEAGYDIAEHWTLSARAFQSTGALIGDIAKKNSGGIYASASFDHDVTAMMFGAAVRFEFGAKKNMNVKIAVDSSTIEVDSLGSTSEIVVSASAGLSFSIFK